MEREHQKGKSPSIMVPLYTQGLIIHGCQHISAKWVDGWMTGWTDATKQTQELSGSLEVLAVENFVL
jgi:hypothetical protein